MFQFQPVAINGRGSTPSPARCPSFNSSQLRLMAPTVRMSVGRSPGFNSSQLRLMAAAARRTAVALKGFNSSQLRLMGRARGS